MFAWLIVAVSFVCVTCHSLDSLYRNALENPDLFEGDIAGIPLDADRNAVVNARKLWPNGEIPYNIDNSLNKQTHLINQAIAEYHKKTCLKFRQKTFSDRNYITFKEVDGCSSPVGFQGGEQILSLTIGCFSNQTIMHELGHAVGFFHEHSRSDRDDYLDIIWQNIYPDMTYNFEKLQYWENNLLEENFDYDSIMMYDSFAFSKDERSKTMIPKMFGITLIPVWEKPGLSASDARRVNRLYQCYGNKRPTPIPFTEFNCDFEYDDCGFKNNENYKAQWVREERTLGGKTGTSMVLEAGSSNKVARIKSPNFIIQDTSSVCINVSLFIMGDGASSISVYKSDADGVKVVYKHSDQSDKWQNLKIQVDFSEDTVRLIFHGFTRTQGEGILAIDDFHLTTGHC